MESIVILLQDCISIAPYYNASPMVSELLYHFLLGFHKAVFHSCTVYAEKALGKAVFMGHFLIQV